MDFENIICLSYLGCSSSFKFEFIIHEQLVTCTVYHCTCHKAVHIDIHLIMLQGQVSTGQTQMKSRVQLTCNINKISTSAQGQTRVFETGFNSSEISKINME